MANFELIVKIKMSHFDDIFRIVKSAGFQETKYGAYTAYPSVANQLLFPIEISPDCRTILVNDVTYVYDENQWKYIDPSDNTERFKIEVEGTALPTPRLRMVDTKDHKVTWIVPLYKRATEDAITSLKSLLKRDHQNLSEEDIVLIIALIAKL